MKLLDALLSIIGMLVELWHIHRTPVILGSPMILLVIYLFIRLWTRRAEPPGFPFSGSPIVEKTKGLDDKRQPETTQNDFGNEQKIRKVDSPSIKEPVRKIQSPRVTSKRVVGSVPRRQLGSKKSAFGKIQPLVFFCSLTGTTEKYAIEFAEKTWLDLQDQSSNIVKPQVQDISYIDYDDYFITPPKATSETRDRRYLYLLLIPTYNIDTVLNNFITHLKETHYDFRINSAPLSSLVGYSVFGFGDKENWKSEAEGFCSQAIEIDKWMARLTHRKRAFPLGLGDVRSDVCERLEEWRTGVAKIIADIAILGCLGEGIQGSGEALESDEGSDSTDSFFQDKSLKRRRLQTTSRVDDLEDIGGAQPRSPNPSEYSTQPASLAIDFTTYGKPSNAPQLSKEMVPATSPTYAALTKQGYAIIGSHSGVKICRWTKSALRGRGSCYKYSFYGIKSHLCMETTPSLSCSNKCVFCWRHGTNPVGTTWRWKIDPPDMIFAGAKEAHLKKIKMMRGVPGVRAERFQEAMKIKHCALSLVGEPIFYPHINEFIRLLHAEKISSFLVCNAQHPDQLQALQAVTQLYVSIDASNKESLKKIDRPLHRDFWERFQRCLDILREKRFKMRTVFRLTLVKGFNIGDEVEGYADLVEKGLPCFVEIKGVTYCGTSSSAGAGLTMQNVPFYEEVVSFVEALNVALARRGLDYGIAAEHAHSCCVLVASKRFLVKDQWHTLIDYDRFFELLESREEFAPEDYMGPPTPQWAAWGQGGFDPADERVYRKGKNKVPLPRQDFCTPQSDG